MSALQLLQKADKYQIFEEWLGLNGAEFSQVSCCAKLLVLALSNSLYLRKVII